MDVPIPGAVGRTTSGDTDASSDSGGDGGGSDGTTGAGWAGVTPATLYAIVEVDGAPRLRQVPATWKSVTVEVRL